ncbi:MAG: FGGY family carbohydrate kinase [Verrucomicrobia bacterium]|nr:FGGY family carbohydrate kinase [Verrucomicrobiota bacterium]
MNLVGIDIGTQGVKVALYSADGECRAEAFEPSRPHRPAPGVVEEDPEFQLASACRLVCECVEKCGARDVAAIGIAGQMAGVIGIGADGRAVTPYDSWLDTRCAAQITRMQTEAGDAVLRATGNAPSFNHGPKILWWQSERPADYARIAKFVQPGGYVALRLCGQRADAAFIDTSYLHFSGFADNCGKRWDAALCARFGVAPEKLPRIVEPSARIGGLTAEFAARCGLPAGTPVIAGCGDTAASFLSCGATAPGICVDVAGTASVFAATTDAFAPDVHGGTLGCGQSVTPGLWHPYAYVNGGGMNLEWFRREFGGAATFDELNKLAAAVVPSDALPLFVPHLGGRVSPGWPALRGAWAGLTWDHARGEMFRAVLEGVALEYALYQQALRRLLPGAAFAELRITGGGEKSAVWNQIKADALQMPIVQIENSGGAPMGAAMLAGVGAGIFTDPHTVAQRWVRLGRRFLPDASRAAHYQKRAARYEALLKTLNEWATR